MANVTFTYNPVPAPACYPPDLNSLANELTNGGVLSGTIPDTAGGGIFVGSSPPSSSLTNKVWFKTDSAGRPLGVYMYYNGNWRKVYTGVGLGEIRMWSGSNGVFDGTGRGVIGSDLDGWALCNGQNATPNLTNRFMVGAQTWSNGYQANPDGQGLAYTGGSGRINCNNLPTLYAQGYGINVAAPTGGGVIMVATNQPYAQGMNFAVRDSVNNCTTGGQVPVMPPWYALCFIMFVGYQ